MYGILACEFYNKVESYLFMKIVSYSVVHYTGSYLPYALKQIAPFVDKSGVFYTANPSHNHSTNLQCPETKQQIYDSVKHLNHVEFIDSSGFLYEGQHRDYASNYMKKTYKPDFVLVVDSDEIWPHETLQNVISFLSALPDEEKRQNWLVNMTHFWRSFNHAINDNMWPVRLIDCSLDDNSVGYIPQELGNVLHFGYAISNELCKYKFAIHGHKNELRPNWYNEKWLTVAMDDVHPTCDDTWYPHEFDKTQLPPIMRDHPYYEMDLIK